MAAAFTAAWLVPNSTESAVANGDTRTIILSNQHTNESGSFTFMVNGVYDQAVLDKLNWFCRDWRLNEPTKMDPHLFDIIWEVYRESGSTQPIDVLSGYRSPQTNAMLRRRSRQVAEHSQHMQGKAIDAHFLDVSTARIRDIAMRMQAGGVGFYPTGITPWVHIDSGSVRYWPQMSRDALTRLFPDGKTVFIPADGQPMPGYEQARAEIEARGGDVQVARGGGIGGHLLLAVRRRRRRRRGGVGRAGSDDRDGDSSRQCARRPQRRRLSGARAAGRGRRRRAAGGRQGQAQLADRPGLRQRPRTGAGAQAEAPSRRLRSPMSGRKRSRRPSATCRPGQAYASAAESRQRPRRPSSRRRSRSSSSPTSPATLRRTSRAAPPAEVLRAAAAAQASRSRRPRLRRRAHASRSSGGSDSRFEDRQAGGAFVTPSNKAFGPALPRGPLPRIITSGVDRAPTGALALAEGASPQTYDDGELLARAAALTAPLPPMPIANVAATAAPDDSPPPEQRRRAAGAWMGGSDGGAGG